MREFSDGSLWECSPGVTGEIRSEFSLPFKFFSRGSIPRVMYKIDFFGLARPPRSGGLASWLVYNVASFLSMAVNHFGGVVLDS